MEKDKWEKLAQLLVRKKIVEESIIRGEEFKKAQDKLAQLFVEKGINKDLQDYNEMWDNALSNPECLEIVGDLIKDTARGDKNLEMLGDYVKALSKSDEEVEVKETEAEKLKKETKYYNEEFKKSLETLKKMKSERISQHYYILQEYTKLLIKTERIFGLLVEGSTGRGKSFQILNTLLNEGKKLDDDFAVLTTYITPLEFYHFCYNNKDKTIVIDDIPELFEDKATIGIILSFLWSATPRRTVEWHSTTSKLKVPKQFNPSNKGKMVIISNKIPESLATVKSRCLNYLIEFTHSEMLELIYEVCKGSNIPMEIADFISQNTDMTTSDDVMNLRLPIKLHEIYRHNNGDWKKLAKAQLNADKEMQILKEILYSGLNKAEQIRQFYGRTGHSRATFYRWKERIERELEYQKLAKQMVTDAKEKLQNVSKSHEISVRTRVR